MLRVTLDFECDSYLALVRCPDRRHSRRRDLGAMDRTLEIDVTDRLLELLARPTMCTGDAVRELPASDYTDPERWRRERDRLFGELPLVGGLSGELRRPGDWKLFEPP